MSKYTNYSELRSIARKRLERLAAAWYVNEGVKFPSVKELKAQGISLKKALSSVQAFLDTGTTVSTVKRQPAERTTIFRKSEYGVSVSTVDRLKKQQYQKTYRQRVKALTDDQRSLIKAAKTLGLKLTPTTVKPFEEYVKYRYAQGIGSVHYFMSNIVEDYMEVTKGRGKKTEDVIADYERFLADRQDLISSWEAIVKGEEPTAQTSDEFSASWLEYIKFRDMQGSK